MMNVSIISDLHGQLPDYKFTNTDLLCICGDISPLMIQHYCDNMKYWLLNDFTEWCNNLNVKKIIFIGGNHDKVCEYCDMFMHENFPKNGKITYINNELYEYDFEGNVYRIYGTPYCKEFGNWYFMKSDMLLEEIYSEIPENLDILLTHDAPKLESVGKILQQDFFAYGKNAGNEILANIIKEKHPKYCFCGHIHSGCHDLITIGDTKIANTSILNEKYIIKYQPMQIII